MAPRGVPTQRPEQGGGEVAAVGSSPLDTRGGSTEHATIIGRRHGCQRRVQRLQQAQRGTGRRIAVHEG